MKSTDRIPVRLTGLEITHVEKSTGLIEFVVPCVRLNDDLLHGFSEMLIKEANFTGADIDEVFTVLRNIPVRKYLMGKLS